MQFTKEIIEKYNRLHREVAEYYGLQYKINTDLKSGLNYITIIDMGYSIKNADKNPGKVLTYLKFEKVYLSDFFKVYHHEQFEITKKDFDMMNYSVKEIRKEKLTIRNRS